MDSGIDKLDLDSSRAVIFFDGVCNLCNVAVTFVIDRDPDAYFRFAPLQSEIGQQLLGRTRSRSATSEMHTALESIVLVENGLYYTHSAAALRIARKLRGGWPLLYGLIILPKPLRDRAYTWVAKNRYRWFGKTEACRLPTAELKRHFL